MVLSILSSSADLEMVDLTKKLHNTLLNDASALLRFV